MENETEINERFSNLINTLYNPKPEMPWGKVLVNGGTEIAITAAAVWGVSTLVAMGGALPIIGATAIGIVGLTCARSASMRLSGVILYLSSK